MSLQRLVVEAHPIEFTKELFDVRLHYDAVVVGFQLMPDGKYYLMAESPAGQDKMPHYFQFIKDGELTEVAEEMVYIGTMLHKKQMWHLIGRVRKRYWER